ncbi:MAG TPA: 3-hydroxyacyl-CoA dehydrogenase NAD-binding domain-containing protein [Xanthomonadales bacterium]|nr:3-hydroxyacyl-CoA dehydrogenase NAD-binding domain-containing protein [Xanthomonadales bacterium]
MSEGENAMSYRHWSLESDIDQITWLTLDRKDENTNSLSREVLAELEEIVSQLEKQPPAGLVLQSGKPGSFIVGADVREFDDVEDPAAASASIREVHALFDRIEKLSFPTAVIIEGFCLGGGLELALAFDYRIVRNDEKTRLGFPEIKLGIYPGFGGSARSTRQIGGMKAMEIMLSTRNLRPGAARAAGLVDELVGIHKSLRWAGRRAVLKKKKSRKPGFVARTSNASPFRGWLSNVMRKKTSARANPRHYPAPFELIDAWERHGDDFGDMLDEEAERVGRLITTDSSKGLRRVFFLMERLKGFGKDSEFKARRVHVIGAGVMGGDIAAWCVLQGLEVTLQDREMKYVEPALKRAAKLFRKKLRSPDLVAGAKSRLIPDVEGNGVARADVIIEAIFENAEAKRSLFADIEPRMKSDAILATNTSAIPLSELATVLEKPERLIGLHFFNPVAKMPLVEIVYGKETDHEQIRRGGSFCGQINRFPLPVKSSPGFLVNRVLAPYMRKAMQIHQEQGVPIEAIDAAAREFGMPMGPVELADTVGLDVGLHVIGMLGGEAAKSEAETLKSMVDKGKLGKKSGEGFYVWKDGKPVKDKDAVEGTNLGTLAESLMEPYFEECRACLADGIVEDKDVLDAGMVFGTGFAPFRGGPMHYLDQKGEQS